MEVDGKPLKETHITGNAIHSTVEQVKGLGSIGQDVLDQFSISEIDLNQLYSYKIRAAIHDAVLKRYGEKALFYLGYTQLDGYEKLLKSIGDPFVEFLKSNRERLNARDLSKAIKSRDEFVTIIGKIIFFKLIKDRDPAVPKYFFSSM